MKKTWERIALIAGILLVLSGVTLLLLGGDGSGDITELGTWLPSEVTAVAVAADSGEVFVTTGGGEEIAAYYVGGRGRFTAEVKGGQLSFSYQETHGLFGMLLGLRTDPKLTLLLPEGYAGRVSLVAGSGSVALNDVQLTGAVSATAGSGTLSVYSCRLNAGADLSAGSGAVFLDDVELDGDLSALTGSGTVLLEDVRSAGELAVTTGSGDVALEEAEAARIRVHTGSGSVSLGEPEARERLYVRTDSGGVSGELAGPAERYTFRCSTGSGDCSVPTGSSGAVVVEIETGSGDIEVRIDD